MNDNQNEYEDLIKIIKALPQATPPANITRGVVDQIPEKRLSVVQLLRRTIAETGKISLGRFTLADTKKKDACFYFLTSGLFFFFIGSVLFISAFYISYPSSMMCFILLESILVLMAAISLVTGGMVVAADMPGSEHWAKIAVMVYGILMILSAMLMAVVVKINLGGWLAFTFVVAGGVTGMTLMKSLDVTLKGRKGSFKRELHNA